METTHRKIELQSPLDVTYLRNNTLVAAREKLDLHFPPSAAPASAADDILKTRVEELVTAYISRVFDGVMPNLSVNGLEGEDMDEAMRMAERGGQELDPYDSKLALKLQSLSSQIEDLTLQLANLRRTAPARASAAYASTLETQNRIFQTARKAAEDKTEQKLSEQEALGLGLEALRDWQECERNWDFATKELSNVKERIGATNARLVQARDAAAYLDQAAR